MNGHETEVGQRRIDRDTANQGVQRVVVRHRDDGQDQGDADRSEIFVAPASMAVPVEPAREPASGRAPLASGRQELGSSHRRPGSRARRRASVAIPTPAASTTAAEIGSATGIDDSATVGGGPVAAVEVDDVMIELASPGTVAPSPPTNPSDPPDAPTPPDPTNEDPTPAPPESTGTESTTDVVVDVGVAARDPRRRARAGDVACLGRGVRAEHRCRRHAEDPAHGQALQDHLSDRPVHVGRTAPTIDGRLIDATRTTSPVCGAWIIMPFPMYIPTW